MKKLSTKNYKESGFTLVELLIVIAVLGVLAAVVLVAIDPLEQLARGRDAGRKSSVAQLGHALQAYFTAHNSAYPVPTADWVTNTLMPAGEIKTVPASVAFTASVTCPTWASTPPGSGENGFCYSPSTTLTEAVVYAQLESKSDRSKCGSGTALAYYTYATVIGRAGIICGTVVDGNTLAINPQMTMVQ